MDPSQRDRGAGLEPAHQDEERRHIYEVIGRVAVIVDTEGGSSAEVSSTLCSPSDSAAVLGHPDSAG